MGKPFSERTVEELEATKKTYKALLIVMAVLVVAMFATLIYFMTTKEDFKPAAMIAASVAVLGGALPSFTGLAAINKELEKRRGE